MAGEEKPPLPRDHHMQLLNEEEERRGIVDKLADSFDSKISVKIGIESTATQRLEERGGEPSMARKILSWVTADDPKFTYGESGTLREIDAETAELAAKIHEARVDLLETELKLFQDRLA